MEGLPSAETPRGRFNSLRDEMLYRMSLDGWAGASAGDVASPYGFFSRITNEPSELESLEDAFGEMFEGANFTATDELVGSFLITESSQGFVDVQEFPSFKALDVAFDQRVGLYESWAEGVR